MLAEAGAVDTISDILRGMWRIQGSAPGGLQAVAAMDAEELLVRQVTWPPLYRRSPTELPETKTSTTLGLWAACWTLVWMPGGPSVRVAASRY